MNEKIQEIKNKIKRLDETQDKKQAINGFLNEMQNLKDYKASKLILQSPCGQRVRFLELYEFNEFAELIKKCTEDYKKTLEKHYTKIENELLLIDLN